MAEWAYFTSIDFTLVGRALPASEITSVFEKERKDEMKKQLFTIAVLRHKVTDEAHGIVETEIAVKPHEVLAANGEAARVLAIAQINTPADGWPETGMNPEELEVFARPF